MPLYSINQLLLIGVGGLCIGVLTMLYRVEWEERTKVWCLIEADSSEEAKLNRHKADFIDSEPGPDIEKTVRVSTANESDRQRIKR